MRGKLVTLWCMLVFTVAGLAQQQTVDEGELEKILSLDGATRSKNSNS
jgi:hypothetical protein